MTSSALLLNGDFRPMRVLSQKSAVKLLLKEKASIVIEGDKVIHAGSIQIPEPKVIHLHKYVYVPEKSHLRPTRKAIMFRDGWKCQYCGAHATTIDHIIPRSKGGDHTWDNVVAACNPCNSKKSDKFLEVLGWDLDIKPRMPSGSFWILVKHREIDPIWEDFLDSH